MGLPGDSGTKLVSDPVSKVGRGRDDKGWMLRMTPGSTPWSSSDSGNSENDSSSNLSDGGQVGKLGEPDGSTMMNLS